MSLVALPNRAIVGEARVVECGCLSGTKLND